MLKSSLPLEPVILLLSPITKFYSNFKRINNASILESKTQHKRDCNQVDNLTAVMTLQMEMEIKNRERENMYIRI